MQYLFGGNLRPSLTFVVVVSCLASAFMTAVFAAPPQDAHEMLVAELKSLDTNFHSQESREKVRAMVRQGLQERVKQANDASSEDWNKIQTKQQWEVFRKRKLAALADRIGPFPKPPQRIESRTTGRIQADGYVIRNVVFQSRPGLWVTGNLYQPNKPGKSMPSILISHSHHRPKEQGELQDMGAIWARAGCQVLAMDHLGHGERRQHSFVRSDDFDKPFRVSRQDYYYRYDAGLQLCLVGESLIGWMVYDLHRAVDFLLQQPGADPKRVALLGAVAGGGDPCAVAAALDERIQVAVPFNFGGPQPETRYPLSEDAEASFNYLGGASWESTRNIQFAGSDGFLPWAIVGSIAPRGLIYSHEFRWDKPRDPVWKRLNRIYGFYKAGDMLAAPMVMGDYLVAHRRHPTVRILVRSTGE